MWVTAARLRAVDPRPSPCCGWRARARPTATHCPQGVGGHRRRACSFVWNNKVLRTLAIVDLAATGPVHADGERAVPQVLHRPQRARATGLGADGAERRRPRSARWAMRCCRSIANRRTIMLTAVLTLGVAMTIIAFLPPLPLILVLCASSGFVYGPIAPIYNYVMQTRAPAASARPGGRRDGVAGLRRRAARAGRGGPARRRRRVCTRRSWRCRCRCCCSAWSRCSCPRCAHLDRDPTQERDVASGK